ncbi:hypothetical protein GPECTOR_22g887 [Gonium pectorale]|uniref:Alpha 1,4-glycosyltransferase domain-containing protein n=1 Tax=Gonium pectorale TaxID=33097 RepID=A0A150GHM7_GONPE|nr:hypothetical protein GPECTOR_22g887 [Gonium pectorale]|eukprot:KXZ49293.1 hypothetical protein GPECTOR_22g887 [Gonium pectorale]
MNYDTTSRTHGTWLKAADLRRLCALESTLRTNPGTLLHVHTENATAFIDSYNQTPLRTLYPDRVVVHQTSFAEIFQGTALEPWYMNTTTGEVKKRPGQQLANAARLVVLKKHGGTYFDLDYIVQKDLSKLPPNYLALQAHRSLRDVPELKGHIINNAFLRFEKPNHPFLERAIKGFVEVRATDKCTRS